MRGRQHIGAHLMGMVLSLMVTLRSPHLSLVMGVLAIHAKAVAATRGFVMLILVHEQEAALPET